MDGEKALINAFKHELRFSTHLYCSIHARKAVKRQLLGRKYTEKTASELAEEIFGKQVGNTYIAGLVDSQSEEGFFEKLEATKAGRREKSTILAFFLDSMTDSVTTK